MNYYQYCKECAGLLVLILFGMGWLLLINPLRHDLLTLEVKEQALAKEHASIIAYASRKRLSIPHSVKIDQHLSLQEVTTHFMRWLNWYTNAASSVHVLASNKLPESKVAHSITEGDISSLSDILGSLTQANNANVLTDFIVESVRDQWRLTADTWISRESTVFPGHISVSSPSIWCGTKKEDVWNHQGEKILPLVALNQLRMIGYLQVNQQAYALLQLPNNTVASIEVGMELGSEHAIVKTIQKNYLLLTLPNQKNVRLPLA